MTLTTRSAGSLVSVILIRNEQSPQWGAAMIEDAEMTLTTACGGNLVSFILNRKGASCPVDSRDY